jgi:hypothetical protein
MVAEPVLVPPAIEYKDLPLRAVLVVDLGV